MKYMTGVVTVKECRNIEWKKHGEMKISSESAALSKRLAAGSLAFTRLNGLESFLQRRISICNLSFW